jgi:hypothetical protein
VPFVNEFIWKTGLSEACHLPGKNLASPPLAAYKRAERGQETIEHIAQLMEGHDIKHLQQIKRILAGK